MTDFEGPFVHPQSPLEQQAKNSQFEPIADTEARIRKESSEEISRLERIINLGQRMTAIKNAPGFQQFEQAISDLRKHAQNEMVICTASNEQLRILQGRCQAFSSILSLMQNTDRTLGSLTQSLDEAKTRAASVIRPDGRVVPESMVGGL